MVTSANPKVQLARKSGKVTPFAGSVFMDVNGWSFCYRNTRLQFISVNKGARRVNLYQPGHMLHNKRSLRERAGSNFRPNQLQKAPPCAGFLLTTVHQRKG